MRSLVILILISVAVSCSQTEEEVEEVPPQIMETNQIVDSLTVAYSTNSIGKLNSFLTYWCDVTPGFPVESIDNDTARNIYQLYMAIYNPFELSEITQNDLGLSIYADLNYIVVQNKVYFDFNYANKKNSVRDSIVDFRPLVQFPKTRTLYLTKVFKNALNIFLDGPVYPLNNYNGDILQQPDSEEKIQFLRKALGIIPSHWGDYWHIETHPEISSIHFNGNLSAARVNFKIGYVIGEAFLTKSTDNWELLESSVHIIE
jgi:hypothetical protein